MAIFFLKPSDIEQIAVAEIIQDYSSVIKELVENSIDGGATDINVEFEDNNNIRVRDNGSGMGKEDLKKSIERYSTSKFKSLEHIMSLGFRGEGLFSLAIVSNIIITSRTKNDVVGTRITVQFGKIVAEEYVSCNIGTNILVKDIFHNMPERKQFLETGKVEWRKIEKLINRLALVFYKITFCVQSKRKFMKYLGCETRTQRISEILGERFTGALGVFTNTTHLHSSEFYLQDPSFGNRDQGVHFISVNNRPVVIQKIHQKILEEIGKFISYNCSYLLFINMDPSYVDSNVDAKKSTVRIGIMEDIIQSIQYFIEKAYGTSKSLLADNVKTPFENKSIGQLPHNNDNNHSTNSVFESLPEDQWTESIAPTVYRNNPLSGFGKLKTQLFNSFILTEGTDCFFLLDQHAAHERIFFNSMKKNFLRGQQLLYSEVVVTTPSQTQILEQNMKRMKSIGLEYEILGDHGINVLVVPVIDSPIDDIKNFIYDMVNILSIHGNVEDTLYREIACHFSIKANKKLDRNMMEDIVNNLYDTAGASFCNHGRRVYIKINRQDIHKHFGR